MKILPSNQLRCLHGALLVVIILLLASSGGQAATRRSGTPGGRQLNHTIALDSGLWERLYRDDNDELKHQDDEVNPDQVNRTRDSASPDHNSQDHLQLFHPERVCSPIVADIWLQESEEISQQQSFVPGIISDWTIAKLSATYGDSYTPSPGGGPSATTIFIGIAATIVLMGAMFS